MTRRLEQKEEALARMLRYLLGSNPAELALLPDAEGWVRQKDLLAALHGEDGWKHVRQTMLTDMAGRLASDLFEADDTRIRCRQRSYAPPNPEAKPPAHLYHGARRRAYPVIKERGLGADDGPGLIVCADSQRALAIGRRRDAEPVLVTIQARLAQENGAALAAWGEEGLFVVQWIDARFLMGPPLPDKPLPKPVSREKKKEKAARLEEVTVGQPQQPPGSFVVNLIDAEKPYKQKGLRKDIDWKKERRKDRRRGED